MATHQFCVFTLLFPLLVQSPQEWLGLDQGLGLNPLLALLLKEVVNAQETCTELRRNRGPEQGQVQSLFSQWISPLLLHPKPQGRLKVTILVRNPTLAPQIEKTHETPPSSRDWGLLFLPDLESNPWSFLQTSQEIGRAHV